MNKLEDKNNRQKKIHNNVIVACYRRPYVKSSLDYVEDFLKKQKIEKVYVLSISEEKKSSANIDSYLGTKDVKDFENRLAEDKKIRAFRYTYEILKICEKLNIDCEKIEKKGKASKIILEEAKKYKPSHIVVHKSDKSKIDKRLSGSVSDEVCKESVCVVTILE